MGQTKLLCVVEAQYLHDYVIRIRFNSGDVRIIDFSTLELKGICAKLRDISYFKNFKLDPFTIDWNNEIGFAPEFLYEKSTPEYSGQVAAEPAPFYQSEPLSKL